MKSVKKMTTKNIKRALNRYTRSHSATNRISYRRYKQLVEEYERRIRR